MDINLAKAEYLLALEKNSMTEDIRNNFIISIEDNVSYLKVFASIIKTLFRQMKEDKITKEEAIDCAKQEYEALSLENFLVNNTEIFPFIEIIFNYRTIDEAISLDLLKKYIKIADKINHDSIVICIYQGVLNGLLIGELIGTDIDFSEKVINTVKNHVEMNEDDKIFLNIIMEAIMYVK